MKSKLISRRCVLKLLSALPAAVMWQSLRAEGTAIRINIPGPNLMPFFPVELVPRLNIDVQSGLRLGIRYHQTGVLALEDMLAGNADFAGVGFPVLPNYLKRGIRVVAISTLSSSTPPYAIIVREPLSGKIRTVSDLRGRTIGVPMGSTTTKTYLQLLAELWLAAYGVKHNEIRWARITQTYDGVYGAMAGETVDAVFCEEPYATSLIRSHLGTTLVSLSDPKRPTRLAGEHHLRAVIVSTPEIIDKHPDRAAGMAEMLKRSLAWVDKATPEAIVDRLALSDPDQRSDIVAALQRLPEFYSRTGGFSEKEISSTLEFMRAVGVTLPDNTDIHSLIDDRWINSPQKNVLP